MRVLFFQEWSKLTKISGIGTAYAHLTRAAQLVGITILKDVEDLEKCDLVHLNFFGLQSRHLLRRAQAIGKKVIVHTHTTREDFLNSFRGSNLIAPLFRVYLASFYRRADALCSPSVYTKNLVASYGVTAPIYPISNGVDVAAYAPDSARRSAFRAQWGLSDDDVAVFCVGHVFLRKGVMDFLQAASALPHTHFFWVGKNYPHLTMGQRKMNCLLKNPPANVHYLGYVKDIRDVFSGADLFFFPSYGENQGIVLLEAMAAQRPIVARDLEAYHDFLVDGRTAILVSDNRQFVPTLQHMLVDSSLRKAFAESAFVAVQEHDLARIGQRLLEIYTKVVSS
ncbi:MAG: glycosyltransferase family 4 protein [Patescibacteria group bacterium]